MKAGWYKYFEGRVHIRMSVSTEVQSKSSFWSNIYDFRPSNSITGNNIHPRHLELPILISQAHNTEKKNHIR